MASNNLYQYSVVSALMHGICETGPSISHILAHGDHGLGTVPHLNGEIIIMDGKAYHFPPDSPRPRKIDPTDRMAFIMITRFNPTFSKRLATLTMSSLESALAPLLPTQQNRFISIRVEATFPQIWFRVIPAQTTPREPLVDLARRQSIREKEHVRGVLFGFWSPVFASGFSVAGFHLHFLSADHNTGGHVVGFEAEDVSLAAASIGEYRIQLPDDASFHEAPLGSVGAEDIHEAEGA
ncbi:alpha-acetolactate decarboxylase [Aspergillus ambiguus]|uniref:acetolactate decarboxylase n=1 Tax=Aspergillus ambiguus TaxID=176160 RepID=UPI003CCDCFDF